MLKSIVNVFKTLGSVSLAPHAKQRDPAKSKFIDDWMTACSIVTLSSKGIFVALSNILLITMSSDYCRHAIQIGSLITSFQIARKDVATFYSLRSVAVETLWNSILQAQNSRLNIVSDDNSGKSHSMPLLVAVRLCKEILARPLLALVEHDPVLTDNFLRFIVAPSLEMVFVMTNGARVSTGTEETTQDVKNHHFTALVV
jgi:hypothetical protein